MTMRIGDNEEPSFYALVQTLKTAEAASDLLTNRRGCPAVVINTVQHAIDDPEVAAALHRAIDDYVRRLRGEIRRHVLAGF